MQAARMPTRPGRPHRATTTARAARRAPCRPCIRMESAGAQYHSANPEAGAMTYRLHCSIVRATSRWAPPRCSRTPSTSRRSCGHCRSPGSGSARTRCARSARRCGSRDHLAVRLDGLAVDIAKLLDRLEGPVALVDRRQPGYVRRAWDVPAALRAPVVPSSVAYDHFEIVSKWYCQARFGRGRQLAWDHARLCGWSLPRWALHAMHF